MSSIVCIGEMCVPEVCTRIHQHSRHLMFALDFTQSPDDITSSLELEHKGCGQQTETINITEGAERRKVCTLLRRNAISLSHHIYAPIILHLSF